MAVDCDFGTNSVAVLLNYLKTKPIVSLNLSKNPLGDENTLKIIDVVSKLQLKELILSSINIGSKCAAHILDSFAGH